MTITIELAGSAGLKADLFVPKSDKHAPLVIGISGGGWIRGHRGALAAWGQYLSSHGIGFASIDYRRVQGGPAWPGNLQDVADGIRAMAKVAPEHGFDASRIAVLGASAGAHLGALAVLTQDLPQLRAFAGIYGVYDLLAHWQADAAFNLGHGKDKTEAMLGCAPFADPQLYHDASPARRIAFDRALPVLLAWGHLDRDIAPAQSAGFAHALRQAGYPVTCVEFAEAGHMWFSEETPDQPNSTSARLAPSLRRFFKRTLSA